jgi:iron complex outermembrane receptor protein
MSNRSARTAVAVCVLALAPVGRLEAQNPGPPGAAPPESVLFESLPVVEAATLHTQTLEQAPASITVLSAEDIRTYGWRTLGEALGAVRGFYLTYDRAYHYAGLRGFSLPGDYNTRFLVMLNGHYLTDNVYSSNGYFGQDFDLDMDLVKRIEVVRGPSSALYGSNGIFATINIVTKSPVEAKRLRATTETGSFGERKVQVTSALNLGHGANLLVSASVFNNSGQSLYFPRFSSPQTNSGWAQGMDGEHGYHAFANLIWRNWSFLGYLGSRRKEVPTGWYGTVFDRGGNYIVDTRGLFEAAYTRDLSPTRKMRWRIYYDEYRFHGRYDYPAGAGIILDNRDSTAGDWVGSQLAYDFTVPRVGTLTVGGELNADLRALQRNYDVSPQPLAYLDVNHPNFGGGVFAQQQWQIAPAWNAYFGVRFDDSRNGTGFVSPRVALVYQASPRSTYKFLWGRAFRDPNQYEMFYADGISQVENAALRPEHADTFEVASERKLTEHWSGLATVYHYHLNDLIQAVTTDAGLVQYRNVERAQASGVEAELSGKPARWIETTASIAVQHSLLQSDPVVINSPRYIAKWRAAAPLFRNKLWASAAIQYLSPRGTVADLEAPSAWLTDLTLTTRALHPEFDIQFGVRNLFNHANFDPVGAGAVEDTLRQDGRSVFVKLVFRTRE